MVLISHCCSRVGPRCQSLAFFGVEYSDLGHFAFSWSLQFQIPGEQMVPIFVAPSRSVLGQKESTTGTVATSSSFSLLF
jgi:hypothetical protein